MTIKRIRKEEVRLGMFIQGLEGSWFDHPFWRSRFVLNSEADLEAIRNSDIEAVLIDVSKGEARMGCEEAPRTPSETPAEKQAEPHGSSTGSSGTVQREASTERCPASEELHRAAAILESSKAAVQRLFAEVRMGNAVAVAEALPLVDEISSSVARNSSALISVARLRTKDEYTYVHSVAVCALLINLGRQLELDEEVVRDLGTAGLLHDIGKLAVPVRVLNKPGQLTDDEFRVIKTHPERGYDILRASGGVSDLVLDVCLHHHERMDGTGYPHRLKGEEISLHSRMAAVCDVYDAITSRRSYKLAWTPSESVSSMYKWSGHFDTDVLTAFIRSIGIYPVGSLVRLESDRLAVVSEHNPAILTKPLVRVFCSAKKPYACHIFDLDLRTGEDRIVSREDPKKWGFMRFESEWTLLVEKGLPPTLMAAAG